MLSNGDRHGWLAATTLQQQTAAQKAIPGLLLLVRMLTSELVAQTISEVCQKAHIAGNTDVESLKALATTLKTLANNSPLMKPATAYLAAASCSPAS